MKRSINYVIALGIALLVAGSARALDSNSGGGTLDSCTSASNTNQPQFFVTHVKAVYTEPSDLGPYDWGYEAFTVNGQTYVATNYAHLNGTNSGEYPQLVIVEEVATYLQESCGLYYDSGVSDVSGVAGEIDSYLTGTNTVDMEGVTVTEHHDDQSFNVSITYSNEDGTSSSFTIERDVDGSVLPATNINPGKDKPGCGGCTSCGTGNGDPNSGNNDPDDPDADGGGGGSGPADDDGAFAGYFAGAEDMPKWSISQPYLDLWVHDKPVFYRTSLGKKIAFEMAYKRMDTRPKDDGLYPTTGWNHNWYSYVRFNIPVTATLTESSDTSIVGTTAPGYEVRANWDLTTNWTEWNAILYAPDNSESYFSSDSTRDPVSAYTLVPISSSGPAISGFRLVHADGSQDIYSLVLGPQETAGITSIQGTVADLPTPRAPLPPVFHATGVSYGASFNGGVPDTETGSAAQTGDQATDVGIYTTGTIQSILPTLEQQIGGFTAETPPSATAIDYVGYDALLTKRIDPYGNAISLVYESSGGKYYLASFSDYDGNTNFISYDTNGFIESVSMAYGRSASFVYSTNGNLLSITDAGDMTSSMSYSTMGPGTNRELTSLTTPYGTTYFNYQDESPYIQVKRANYFQYVDHSPVLVTNTNTIPIYIGQASVNHSISVTYPDNSSELYLYCGSTNGLPLPETLSPSEAISSAVGDNIDTGAPGSLASLLNRNSFHWTRAQTALLSRAITNDTPWVGLTAGDYALGTMQHYLAEPPGVGNVDFSVSYSPSLIRDPSPDGVQSGKITWMSYSAQSSSWQVGTNVTSWTAVTESPDGTPLVTAVGYDDSGRLSSISETCSTDTDGSASTRTYSYSYWDIPVDTGSGTAWSLSAFQSLTGPASGTPLISVSEPGTNAVGGYTVLSQPCLSVVNIVNDTNTFYFNSRHQLSGLHLARGLTVTNLFGSDGFLQKSIGVQTQATNTFGFYQGQLATNTTPLGLTLRHTYDPLGRHTGTVFPDNTSVSNIFDRLDLVARKDRLGNWSHAQYDNLDRLTQTVSRNNQTNRFEYCLCGGLESVADPLGNTNFYTRDNLGRVIGASSAVGTATLARDILGRPIHLTTSYGVDLKYGYNYQGLLVTETNAAGQLFALRYDVSDNLEYVTDAQGLAFRCEFDELGRIAARHDPADDVVQSYVYSAQGLAAVGDAYGNTNSYGYDSAGRLMSLTNANLEVTQVGRDAVGHITTLTDGRNHTKTWTYDIYGRQLTETDANNVLVRTNGYDANGRLTASWTPAHGLTHFAYDAVGNLTSITYPTMGTAAYSYDGLNRMLMFSNGFGNCSLTYSNFAAFSGAVASDSGPWTGDTVSYGYTGAGLASVGLGSWSKSISRDSALRPYGITSPAGTFTYGFKGTDRLLASLQMPGSTNIYGYDSLGFLNSIQVKNASGAVLDNFGYDHDLNGRITKLTRLYGETVNYGYDNIGQLISAEGYESNDVARLNENLTWGYDASDNLKARTNNTLIQTFASDAADQLTNILRSGTLTVIGSVTNTVATLSVNGTNAAIYSDGTFATTSGLPLHDGNNLFVSAGSNSAGALVVSTVTPTRLPVSVNLSYDKNGNLLNDGLKSYTYDDADELASVSEAGLWRSEFVYDALGRRRIKKDYSWSASGWAETNETRYVYEGRTILQERDNANTVKVTYTRGMDLSGGFGGAGGIGGLLARTDSSGSLFYHGDAGGNITSLADSSGNVVGRYLYDPFGTIIGKTGSAADANAMRFSSMPWHDKAGLSLYVFRAYSSTSQRWTQRDPIGEFGGPNLYQFVYNSPVYWIDLFGLDIWIEGPSGSEPNAHQSINVGDPFGDYYSQSFGVDGLDIWNGGIYEDIDKGGPIEKYLKTTPEQDAEFLKYLKDEYNKDEKKWYGPNTCRTYSQDEFEKAKKKYSVKESTPPKRKPAPRTFLRRIFSSSNSSSTTTSSSGTGSSR